MALIPLLALTAVSEDGTTSTLTDGTVYGAPGNPFQERVDEAVYLTAYKVAEDLVETTIPITTFDPETASSFTITNDVDGWYKFYFVIINRWLVGTTYNRYDLTWSESEQGFYQYINVTPSSGNAVTDLAYFNPVADPTSTLQDIGEASEPTNITYQIYEYIIDYQTAKCYGTAAMLDAKENCGYTGNYASGSSKGSDCTCGSKTGKAVARLRTLLAVMRIANVRGQYLEGERFARLAEKYCDDCGCLNR